MTAILPLVDAELAASRWLRADPDVTALVAERVYTSMPAEKVWPLLRVIRVGGAPEAWPLHVDRADLQLDSWGGSKHDAYDVIRAAITALYRLTLPGAYGRLDPELQALGVLTRISWSGLGWLPDVDVPRPIRRPPTPATW